MQLTGLIPAAGTASRLAPIPCSKEIYPVASAALPNQADRRPKSCCQYLLEKMQIAGAAKAYIVLRDGKWDIPAYLGDGSDLGIRLAYLMMNLPFGVPFTLDQAYPFVKDALILFGFPDILFLPENAYIQMLEHLRETGADMVLGLFAASEPESCDTVNLNADGRIAGIEIKNKASAARYSWINAVWRPVFTDFLHTAVKGYIPEAESRHEASGVAAPVKELYLGQVIADALAAGLNIEPFIFEDGKYLDIGTVKNLSRASEF